jgi:hypothetical protein
MCLPESRNKLTETQIYLVSPYQDVEAELNHYMRLVILCAWEQH